MLRIAVLILVLANAGYYAWSQGMLRDMGWGPTVQSEQQRLAQQIDPQKMQVTASSPSAAASTAASHAEPASAAPAAPAASAASAPASAPTVPASQPAAPASVASTHTAAASPPQRTVCLQAGSFDESQAQAWRTAAKGSLPEGSWKLDPTNIAGRWMVYIGKLPDDDALTKKRAELRNLQIDYDRPGPAFEPGLSLGRFSTDEAAQRALTQLTGKGVRTAKVVVERKETTVYTLKLPAVDDTTRSKLNGMKSALSGKPLQSCT